MGPLKWFLFVYVLGGITFLPLLLVCALVFVYLTSPPPPPPPTPAEIDDPADLIRDNDDKDIFRSGTDDLADKFHRKHDGDVAAGYFAVCREFVPGGVKGRPPEKAAPAGEPVVNESSPSVYQTMYRSIFDRPQKPTIEPQKDPTTTKNAKKTNKQANNIFYVVLRHGHLMLYDDIQQLEVRYVISLDYHDVDIYSGNDQPIPEGELWSKRHAIRLKRKPTQLGDRGSSLPFFLFTEFVSDKEDFYFALLKNQRRTSNDVPEAETFDIKHIVSLVQKLHSSEEHLATRWLNALIGRLFLALYRTEELEDFICAKLTKKLSRVKKPNFITRLALRKIDLGTGAPFITNPRLKDLTVNGECTIEADVDYSGNFKIELGATARIDLGTRFKPRDMDLVLTVTVKKLRGHGLLHLKPPPSNRVWISFEKMPHLELAVEPIVSSRQITLTVVLRAIESRIREVVAESLVLPFWDDVPFLLTFNQKYRGGIWKREEQPPTSVEVKNNLPEDETGPSGSGRQTPESIHLTKDDRNLTMPILPDTKKFGVERKSASLVSNTHSVASDKTPTSPPRLMRSSSLATVADPKVTIGHVDNDGVKLDSPESSKRDSASMVLKDLTARSHVGSASGSPPAESSMATAIKRSSDSLKSKTSSETIPAAHRQYTMNYTTTPRSSIVDLTNAPVEGGLSASPGASAPNSRPASIHGESAQQKMLILGSKTLTAADRKKAVASAQASAQKWSTMGWGVLARNRQQPERKDAALGNGRPSSPMGRGQPLPPPGQPLPTPQKPLTIAGMANSMLSRRKPGLAKKASDQVNGSTDSLTNDKKVPAGAKRPPPNKRKESSRVGLDMDNGGEDEVMVVEAPIESQPASPAAEADNLTRDDFFGHGEDSDFQPTDVQQENNAVDEDASDSTNEAPDSVSTSLPDTAKHISSHGDVPTSPGFDTKGISTAVEPDTPSKTSPTLHSRRPTRPLSPSSSGRRSPLAGNALEESEDGLPLLPQAVEASNRERSLSYMEAASGGGGYNE